jgi:hypothetical protein
MNRNRLKRWMGYGAVVLLCSASPLWAEEDNDTTESTVTTSTTETEVVAPAEPAAPTVITLTPDATPVKAAPPKAIPVAELVVVPHPLRSDYYIGHRFFEEKGGGWGWVKRPSESWSSAMWVALKEDPFHDNGGVVAPFRKLGKRSADQDYEYKLYGTFAPYSAYDPHLDEKMAVFVLEGYESLGEAKPLERKPGPPGRFSRSHRSHASSRASSPIITDRENDAF